MLLKLITFFALVFFPIAAFADPAVDKPYERGIETFLKGEFSNAIFHFKDAYQADIDNGGENDPLIPLNLSICYEKLGNFAKALEFAEEAQSGDLGDATDKNSGRIAVFRRVLKAQSTATKIDRVNKNEVLCSSDTQCDNGLICSSDGACIVDESIEYEESRLGALGYTGGGLMVVGAGLLAYSIIVFDAEVGDLEEQLQDTTLSASEITRLEEEQSDARSTGLIVLAAGAGTAAIGMGLLIYDLATVEKVPVAIVPVLSPDRMGANFSIDF